MVIGQNHPIQGNNVASNSDILSDNYCITMNLDKFLDFWNDIHSLEVSIIAGTLGDGIVNVSNLSDAFLALNTINTSTNISAIGACYRKILPVGLLKQDGSLPLLSQTPNTILDYPIFDIGILKINFGESKYRDGLFYPRIELNMGADFGFNGILIGGIDFEGYGFIPIYTSIDILQRPFAFGSVRIKNRYSDIKSSSRNLAPGSSFRATYPLDFDLSDYKYIYFGGVRKDLNAFGGLISVQIPENAKPGLVSIENPGRYDLANLYEDHRIIN